MARSEASKSEKAPEEEARPICGIIMPISDSSTHSAAHWDAVRKLLHRAVYAAGFEPQNVWDELSTDDISRRIVQNIFDNPMVVCDISDLNPNVMFELGLRLTSAKPTVVIREANLRPPFDIASLHVEPYPADMNMLGMEAFMAKLEDALKAKYAHFKAGTYKPYLEGLKVETLEPTTEILPLDKLVLSRMEEVLTRLSALERSSTYARPKGMFGGGDASKTSGIMLGSIYGNVPSGNEETFPLRKDVVLSSEEFSELAGFPGVYRITATMGQVTVEFSEITAGMRNAVISLIKAKLRQYEIARNSN